MSPVGRKAAPAVAAAAALLCLAGAVGGGEVAQTALRGAAVVALLAAVAFALRRRRAVATARPARLAIEERLPLGRETGLALVTAHGRRLLVGHGPAGVSLLAELAADGEPPR